MQESKLQADLEKIHAEIGKLIAETAKINAEARWFPFVAVAGIFAAAVGLVKLFVSSPKFVDQFRLG